MNNTHFSRRDFLHKTAALASMMACPAMLHAKTSNKQKPNFVVFMIDDLGYGDLACYGSKVRTPNIDKLARSGMRFTDFHSNGPMCSPTRAAFLAGCYQNRFGSEFESALGGQSGITDNGLPQDVVTLPEILKKAGYKTAMFGKWHLGYKPPKTPASQGFDEFRGLLTGDGDHYTHIDRSGNKDWWHNDNIEMEKGYTATLLTDHSVNFINENKNRPFFLYLAHLAIHFPWQGPDDPPQRKEGKGYHKDKWGIIPDEKNVRPHVEAMIKTVDKSVQQVMDALKKNGLIDNTFVIFMSDNGGYLHYDHRFQNISSNGPLRGQKCEVYEGGHRVPCITYWQGKIKPGQTTGQVVLSMDFYPTIAKIAGADLPADQASDGVDISALLFKCRPVKDRTVFWRRGSEKVARKGPWKLILRDQDCELYNLTDDIGETKNLADAEPKKRKQLVKEIANWEKQIGHGYKI